MAAVLMASKYFTANNNVIPFVMSVSHTSSGYAFDGNHRNHLDL